MDIRTEIVALAVRALSDKTDLVKKPDTFTEIFATMSTGKTYDERIASDLIGTAEKIADFAKKTITNRKFKKITKNV